MHSRLSPPQSITGPLIAIATLAGAALGSFIVFVLFPHWERPLAALILVVSVSLPCAAVEFYRTLHRAEYGLDFCQLKFSASRTVRKIAALWAIFAVLLFCYSVLPVYRAELYQPFDWLLGNFLVWLLLLSIPYVFLVDAAQVEPKDSLYAWGDFIFNASAVPGKKELNYLLGWGVKGFFLPLMFCYLANQLGDVGNVDLGGIFDATSFQEIARRAYSTLYVTVFFVDVLVATAGYMMTLRLLGTEIRSVEPTVAGWLVALACYDPFWPALFNNYFNYMHGRSWGDWLAQTPMLYALWAAAIVFLILVYGWATVSFGIRFSNLTYRGIVTSGPYRWTKHPAYVSKNLSWWLISIPFLPADGSVWTALPLCLGLLGINGIYFLRAKTEERHLSQDPVYREYAAYIREHGIFRWLAWRPGRSASDMPRGTPDVI